MPFPQSPYNIRVGKVQVDSVDVSNTQFRLENTTKSTETLKSSSETDSNIAINLAECGDWDINDNIKITGYYYSKVGSSVHQVVSGNNGSHDFGTIAMEDAATGGGTLVNGGLAS